MSTPQIERKLAAIMFTDIAGFTEQMSKDEAVAISLLNKQESILKPLILEHNGTYVKNTGDGTLSHFNSAVDAATCAKRFQESIYDDKDLNVRVGVHLGDTIFEKGDIRGDGVNIASRLESMAVEGGVFVSKEVHDQLANQKEFEGVSIGLQSMKGVGRLIEVFGLKGEKLSEPNPQSYHNNKVDVYSSNEIPSLTLIPFRNKGKIYDDFYSYSLSLDIMSKISSSSNIIVSSMEEVESLIPKNNSKEIQKILRTRYSITGSLWKKDDVFNLSIELFDGKKNKMIWANSWLENWDNLPNIETKISNNIIKILDNKSIDRVEKYQGITIIDSETYSDSEAYRIYLKGKYIYHNRSSDKEILKSKSLFKKSISLDPNLIQPKMLLGEICFNRGEYEKSLEIYNNNLKMSIDVNDSKNISSSLSAIASIYFQKGNYEKSLEYNLQALKIREKIDNKKGIARSLNSIGAIYDVLKEYDKALEYYKKSIMISKEHNDSKSLARGSLNISNLYNTKNEFDKALNMQKECIKLCKKSHDIPLLAYAYNLGGVIFSNLHKYDQSLQYLKKCLKIRKKLHEPEGIAMAFKSIGVVYYHKGQYRQAMIYHKKSLKHRKEIGFNAGVGESLSYIGDTYKKIGEYDNAIDAYQKSYEILIYIKDYEHASRILTRLGNIYRKMGEYGIALKTLKKAEKIKKEINDYNNLGYILLEISSVYRWQGKRQLALDYNSQSIKLAKEHDQQKLVANNLYHKSLMSININNFIDAKKNINQAIDIARDLELINNKAKYLDCLGIIYRHEKEYNKALNVINESLSISKSIGDKHGERKYLNSIGLVKEFTGDYKSALNLYSKCLVLSKIINEKRSIAVSYNNIGCIYEYLNEWELANKNFKKALTYSKRINYKEGTAAYQYNIAFIFGKCNEYKKSFQYLNSSIKEHAELNLHHPFIMSCNIYKIFLYVLLKDEEKVSANFAKIKKITPKNNLGYEKNWELYQIYNFLGLNSKLFLKQTNSLLLNEIHSIVSNKDKDYFVNNVGYNRDILEEWEKVK